MKKLFTISLLFITTMMMFSQNVLIPVNIGPNNYRQPNYQGRLIVQDSAGIRWAYIKDTLCVGMSNPISSFQVKNLVKFNVTDSNTFIGYLNGETTTGNGLTFIGHRAGWQNTTGSRNTFIGHRAGYDNTTGTSNVFVGQHAGLANTTGTYNTNIGNSTGGTVTTTSYNTNIGYHAGYLVGTVNSGERNTFVGFSAGYKNTTGKYNSCFGFSAGADNTTGEYNTYMGYDAAYNSTGGYNVNIGSFAGRYGADSNVFVGYRTGYLNKGSLNAMLGFKAGYNDANGSNKLYIENSNADSSDALIYGEFNNNFLRINYRLSIDTTPGANLFVHGTAEITSSLLLGTGTSVNEFSTDGTLADDSDDALVTEKAIKTYVDGVLPTTYWDKTDGSIYPTTITDSIGIGTASPTEMLDVAGNIDINGNTLFLSDESGDIQSISTNSGNIVINSDAYSLLIETDAGMTVDHGITMATGSVIYYTAGGADFLDLKDNFIRYINGVNTLDIKATPPTSNVIQTYQNATGTIALTSDIPSGAGLWSNTNDLVYLTSLDDSVGIGLNNPNNVFQVKDLIEFNPTNFGLFLGYQAGTNNTGNYNTFLGYQTGLSNISGKQNVFIGYLAGNANTTGSNNIFIGESAGISNTTGFSNSFVGRKAGESNTEGSANSFFGKECGRFNATGTNNTAFGTQALKASTTGSSNTAFGNNSLVNTTDADSNAVFGMGVLVGAHTYKRNVVIGAYAGTQSQPMSGCVILGSETGYTNSTSNRLMIDNSQTNTPLLDGDFSTNTLTINDNLKVAGANFRHRTTSATDYNPSILTEDYIIAITSTGADRAVTISTEDVATGSTDNPRIFIIKDEGGGAGANNITITLESGGTIDGGASAIITVNNDARSIYVDGTNAHIF